DDVARVLDYFPALKNKLSREAGTLSGGEQQMLAIARGMMARPKLLMIDELSLGLAPNVVDRLIDVVQQINRDGTALILVLQHRPWNGQRRRGLLRRGRGTATSLQGR